MRQRWSFSQPVFPALQQRGECALLCSLFCGQKTFTHRSSPYPILAGYFILLNTVIISVLRLIHRRLNRPPAPVLGAEKFACV